MRGKVAISLIKSLEESHLTEMKVVTASLVEDIVAAMRVVKAVVDIRITREEDMESREALTLAEVAEVVVTQVKLAHLLESD
jgi:hypothetical protein